MKVFFHEDFFHVYTRDPSAARGRLEAIVKVIGPGVDFVEAVPALDKSISAVHTKSYIRHVRRIGLFPIASLAAGGAIQAADTGIYEPCFGLIRPPGHIAYADKSWQFSYLNNMAIAIQHLKTRKKIRSAYVLDIDFHLGEGTADILKGMQNVIFHQVQALRRDAYIKEIEEEMQCCRADIIGISAGFDNHVKDWGGVLKTEDYFTIGQLVRDAAERCGGGCFALLEGGYNHEVLGNNVLALISGLSDW